MKTAFEKWASGEAYEQFMGKWSAEVASLFLDGLQPVGNVSWLDVGCGTGALVRVIASRIPSAMIVGVDLSLDFVQYAHRQTRNAQFVNASAVSLPVHAAAFDYVVSGLALNFVPHPEQALREFVRVLKPGGIAAAYLWDYAEKMEFLRYFWDAASALNPAAKSLHEGHRFPLCRPDPLKALWQDAGLTNIVVHPLDVVTVFEDFDAYWQPFTLGNFPAPQYAASLDDTSRAALRDRLRSSVPIEQDGSIHLTARAWAVSGEKPQASPG